MSRVLVVSEDTAITRQLESTDRDDTFVVTRTGWGTWDVKSLAGQAADVFLFDYRNPGTIPGGVIGTLAAEIREHDPQTPVVFVADFDPMLREMIQAAVGGRNVAFADTGAFADVNHIRRVLLGLVASHRSEGGTPAAAEVPGKKAHAFPHLLPELRNPETGRLDAKRVGVLFAVPLSRLAKSLGADAAAVYKTPDSPALQTSLLLYERIARSLLRLVGSEEGLRIWLNTPEPDLDNEIPRDLLLSGEGEVVADLLEDMRDGQPG